MSRASKLKDSYLLGICLLVFASVFCFSCATYKLERRLPVDLKDWYDMHRTIMESEVPRWIGGANGSRLTERQFFLRLPTSEMQEKYKEIFWEIRRERAEEVFASRVEVANKLFRYAGKLRANGWRSDMGQVLILCSEPIDIRVYRNKEMDLTYQDHYMTNPMGGEIIQEWLYYHPGIGYLSYYFRLGISGDWRRALDMERHADIWQFEQYWQEIWGPTPDGWDIVYGVLSAGK